jgi:hypothetical protein
MTHINVASNTENRFLTWGKNASALVFAAVLIICSVTVGCSSDKPKPVSSNNQIPVTQPQPQMQTMPAPAIQAESKPVAKKPVVHKKPATVNYTDKTYGVTFEYPRRYAIETGDAASELIQTNPVPMNFVQPGGITVAAVELPGDSYPDTDFESAFFNVNVNRSVSEQDCARFASVDTRKADGEPIETAKVKVGATDMDTTSNFSANVIKQAETQYYHSYEAGACYEYVLGMGTEGFATEGGVRHVNRDQVFAKLEKILATVKVAPGEPERAVAPAVAPAAEAAAGGAASGPASDKE